MAPKKTAPSRRRRAKPPVRTPVEGDWLRLHVVSGQGYVIAPDEHGRRRRIYVGAYYADPAKRDLNRLTVERAARVIRESQVLGSGPTPEADALTVDELVEKFLAYAKDYYRADSNEYAFFAMVLGLAAKLYGSVPADNFGPLALKAVRAKMVASDRWNRATLNAHIGRVKRAFKWAASNELIPVSVFTALSTVEGLSRGRTAVREPGSVLPVKYDHVTAVLPHLSRQVRAMIELQRHTAMRPGEVVILRPCDVDRSSGVWTYRPAQHKNVHRGHERTVYLGPKAQGVLKPFLLRAATEYAFSPAEAEEERLQARQAARKTPPTYGNARGTNRVETPDVAPGDRYTVGSFRKAVQRACDAARVPKWSPNQLRHSRATEVRAEFGIEAARVTLGHRDAGITLIYAERDDELARRVAAKLG